MIVQLWHSEFAHSLHLDNHFAEPMHSLLLSPVSPRAYKNRYLLARGKPIFPSTYSGTDTLIRTSRLALANLA
jgi:hypothetical protein